MAYNTKNIVRDASGAPIPQLFNPAADEYQPLEGTGGAHKTQLTGSTVPVAVTMQNAAAANGNGTNLTVTGLGTAVLTVSGTFSATVNFEGSNDGGTSWFPHLATKMGDGAIANATFTTGQYRLNVAGVDLVRARVSGYASGTVTVVGKTSSIVAPSKAITIAGSRVEEVTFQTAATVAAQGTALTVGGLKTLTVEIAGTSTSRTIAFQCAGPSGAYRTLTGVRLSDFAIASTTTTTDEIWQFDITGLVTVIMNLTAVAGGNVTVRGRAVA